MAEGAELVPSQVVARHLAVSDRTIRNWALDGRIPVAFQKGRVMRFRLEDVLA